MKYIAGKTNVVNPDINSPEWEKAPKGKIDNGGWEGYEPSPDTEFQILKGPEGISIRLHTNETKLKAECTEQNGMVCRDSCMEFFFKPSPWDLNYLNFEMNPNGIAHIGLGKDRYGRLLIEEDRATFSIVSDAKEGNWTLKYYIPDSFVLRYFDKIAKVCKGNFYKCGTKDGTDHYGTWSPVETESPDFHLADFFGRIEL